MLRSYLVSLFSVLALFVGTVQAATTWEIDPVHSQIGFKIRHMMVSNVKGSFKEFKGWLTLDEKAIAKSTAEITINPATIDTANEKRDEHLRSKDFFEVETHKEITFKSKKFAKKGKGFTITGDLTMHGVTKEMTFDVSELTPTQKVKNQNGEKTIRGLSATGSLNRKDYNMVYNSTIDKGGLALGDKVDITIELELSEKAADTAPKTEEKKS